MPATNMMKVTFLGTGTSQGIPVILCACEVCRSADPRDNRLRCSVKIETEGRAIVIDTGPDFREQMLRSKTTRLDAVLYTHEHKDHIAGLDDIRPFNFIGGQHIHVYATAQVEAALHREFSYAFAKEKYPGVPELSIHRISNNRFEAAGIPVTPIRAMHAELPVTGFRIGGFTYLTDANHITPDELQKARGSDVFVVNALRREKHYSHFNLEEALEIIRQVAPKKAYLTHISHRLGLHADLEKELPGNVEIAYDGLTVDIPGPGQAIRITGLPN